MLGIAGRWVCVRVGGRGGMAAEWQFRTDEHVSARAVSASNCFKICMCRSIPCWCPHIVSCRRDHGHGYAPARYVCLDVGGASYLEASVRVPRRRGCLYARLHACTESRCRNGRFSCAHGDDGRGGCVPPGHMTVWWRTYPKTFPWHHAQSGLPSYVTRWEP